MTAGEGGNEGTRGYAEKTLKTSPESGKKFRMRTMMLNLFLHNYNLKVSIEGVEMWIY